jgi:adenylate kinase
MDSVAVTRIFTRPPTQIENKQIRQPDFNFLYSSALTNQKLNQTNQMINLILFGPPGAGKGTQSAKLIEKYSLTHISTGDLFRKHLKEGTALGKLAQDYMSKGNLVPDQVVIDMVDDKIKSSGNIEGIIFDGFPRTIPQAEALDRLLESKNAPIKILVELMVPEDELKGRLADRATKENRPDDAKPEVIANRISVYKAETMAVADYYKKNNKYASVVGVGEIEQIFKNICREVDKSLLL